MFEYAFVTVPVNYGSKASPSQSGSYQAVIVDHARQGWRLVQVLVENPAAVPTEYTLIFERSDASA